MTSHAKWRRNPVPGPPGYVAACYSPLMDDAVGKTAKQRSAGTVYAAIRLINPKHSRLKPVDVEALVDTGVMTICIPEHIAIQLQPQEIEKREVITADDRLHWVPYVGPIQIQFPNRTCFTGALAIGRFDVR